MEKVAAIKRFKDLSWSNELKKQAGIVKKQYQELGKVCEKSKMIKNQHLKSMVNQI